MKGYKNLISSCKCHKKVSLKIWKDFIEQIFEYVVDKFGR